MDLPSGTVTFLFTDLEASTRLWEQHPDDMLGALARHDEILRSAIAANGGHIVKTTGDGVHAVFTNASRAVDAAVDAQRALRNAVWGEPGELRVRMGLHSGVATVHDGDYPGPTVNKAARVMSVANGGQIVVSLVTAELVRERLRPGVELVDLGEHRLRDLSRAERLYQVDVSGQDRTFPPLRSIQALPGNLPRQASSFVGREREIALTVDALRESRVVTFTGVGGVGKTRLALHVAGQALSDFRDGAWLVELASLRAPDGVIDAFATVFGITARRNMTTEESLIEFLRSKELLLVVDNCEHVLEAASDLVGLVERSCDGVVVLATSRERLALEGERALLVPSLEIPREGADLDAIADTDAVRLFVERAHAVDIEFTLADTNAGDVVQVCRRLDGVPLAIELAAALVPVMNPAELAVALDRRFEVLARSHRRAIERHQTLRAAIDWSYDLLSGPHRRLLARLSVFAGGSTRDAIAAVCVGDPVEAGAVFGLLADLVARSLVVTERGGVATRFRLLETIRAYGAERLAEHGETRMLRDRHAQYYVEHGGAIVEGLRGPGQVEWGNRLLSEIDDYMTAMSHALDTKNVDLALGLIELEGAMSGPAIGSRPQMAAEPVLALPGVQEHRRYPTALMVAAVEARTRGEFDIAQRRCAQALDAEFRLASPPSSLFRLDLAACNLNAAVAATSGAFLDAAQEWLVAATLAGAHGDAALRAANLGHAANALALADDREAAIAIATEGLVLARTVGMPTAIVFNLFALAQALADRDPDRSRSLLDEAINLNADLGYEHQQEVIGMTLVAARLGDWCLTTRLVSRSIRHLHWNNNERAVLAGMLNVGARVLADADPECAARLQGSARSFAVGGAQVTPERARRADLVSTDLQSGLIREIRWQTTQRLNTSLGERALHELRDEGAVMSADNVVTYALSHLEDFATRSCT